MSKNNIEDCSICLEKLENKNFLPCGHYFHKYCVDRQIIKKCALCRYDFSQNTNNFKIRAYQNNHYIDYNSVLDYFISGNVNDDNDNDNNDNDDSGYRHHRIISESKIRNQDDEKEEDDEDEENPYGDEYDYADEHYYDEPDSCESGDEDEYQPQNDDYGEEQDDQEEEYN
jgi:hypothetical protein